ncbi:hypothetical protein Bresu_1405 [Brevundimonas subvibrioides ATCC 15264]|uniref:Uncharacterized protein n=1 Tax=Brevundimonas subvibrioides (strain ATCC 15264 / DSM 4735 / LMG 14903 / NBRC 16000 / CB 81) TaxID=633149 RepID=D9QG03_BRESC|nr:hypothetical protein Bresu_1405 [Brevundimonas subvibrioides ATCC 15264]
MVQPPLARLDHYEDSRCDPASSLAAPHFRPVPVRRSGPSSFLGRPGWPRRTIGQHSDRWYSQAMGRSESWAAALIGIGLGIFMAAAGALYPGEGWWRWGLYAGAAMVLFSLIWLACLWFGRSRVTKKTEDAPQGPVGFRQDGGRITNHGKMTITGRQTAFHQTGGTLDNKGTLDVSGPVGEPGFRIDHMTIEAGRAEPAPTADEPKPRTSRGWVPGFDMPWLGKKTPRP